MPRKLSGCHPTVNVARGGDEKRSARHLGRVRIRGFSSCKEMRTPDRSLGLLGLPFLSSRFFGRFIDLASAHSMAARANSAGCTPKCRQDGESSASRVFLGTHWAPITKTLIDWTRDTSWSIRGKQKHPKRNLSWHSASAFLSRWKFIWPPRRLITTIETVRHFLVVSRN